jgi:hypothetical protein
MLTENSSIWWKEQTFIWNLVNVSDGNDCYIKFSSPYVAWWYYLNSITFNSIEFYTKITEIYKWNNVKIVKVYEKNQLWNNTIAYTFWRLPNWERLS